MDTIMVRIGEQQWTKAALHLACAMARSAETEIVLVKMIPVQHTAWLGTEFGYHNLTQADRDELNNYRATAEDYGIVLRTEIFQYITLPDAIADAAEYFNVQIVFSTLPKSVIPYWRSFQMWTLRRRLSRQQRRLYSLEQPSGSTSTDWVPSILVHAEKQ